MSMAYDHHKISIYCLAFKHFSVQKNKYPSTKVKFIKLNYMQKLPLQYNILNIIDTQV